MDWLNLTLNVLGSLVRLIGMVLYGLGVGWFVLEFFRKTQPVWQLQLAIFLGFVGLGIAMADFLAPAALGGFGIGIGVAMFLWGMPRPEKKKEEEKE